MTCKESIYLVGTSGWSYPHWFGAFYPDDFPKSRWFQYYARNFSTVEVNATFYRFFKDHTYRNWYAKAPSGFKYVLKVPKVITHTRCLKNVDEPVRTFCNSIKFLEEKLGLVLLQIAPRTVYDLARLEQALLLFDDPTKVAVEFRDPKWITDDTRSLLERLGVVFCDAESPDSNLIGWLTSETAYLRLHGRTDWYCYEYKESDLFEIAGIAAELVERGARNVYIYFNNDYEGFAPNNALRLKGILQGQNN